MPDVTFEANTESPVTQEYLQQTWDNLQATLTEEERQSLRAANALERPLDFWDRFKATKIWVKNGAGLDLIVYVHRFNKIAELKSIGGRLGADATGAQIEAHLELQRSAARVQIEPLSVGDDVVMFDLGAGGTAGYVTAAIATNKGLLVSKDRIVSSGYCLHLRATPVIDPELNPEGAAAASAAAAALPPARVPPPSVPAPPVASAAISATPRAVSTTTPNTQRKSSVCSCCTIT